MSPRDALITPPPLSFRDRAALAAMSLVKEVAATEALVGPSSDRSQTWARAVARHSYLIADAMEERRTAINTSEDGDEVAR